MLELFARTSTRYLVGALLGLVATWIVAVTPPSGNNTVMIIPSTTVVIAIVVVGGLGPAIVAATIPLVATMWFLLPPVGSLAVHDPTSIVKLVLTFAMICAGSWLEYTARRERRRLTQHERELLESEGRYRMLLEHASDAILVFNRAHEVVLASTRAGEMLGVRPDELKGQSFHTLLGVAPEERADTPLFETIITPARGLTFTGEVARRTLPDGGMQVIIRDVTSRQRAVAVVQEERDLLDRILDTSEAGIIAVEVPSRRVVFANRRLTEMAGVTREGLAAGGADALPWEYATPEGEPLPAGLLPSSRSLGEGRLVLDDRILVRQPGAEWRLMSVNAGPLVHDDGRVRAVVLSMIDITERTATEAALKDSEGRLRRLTDAIPGVVYQYVLGPGGDQRFTFASRGVFELLGISPGAVLADFNSIWQLVLPEERDGLSKSIAASAQAGTRWTEEFQLKLASGERKWIRGSSVPEPPLPDGSIVWNGLLLDITERKRLETDLLQVQEMESIGRLAGGIAHDFNNILTAIRGNVDLLLEDVTEEHATYHELRDIRDAAERATALTRQLLAFSRKQAMQVRDLELGSLVRDMEKMLRRVIGEDVVLLTQPTEPMGLVRADPGQIEQVLLNLAVNARDAMPDGGLLTIETRNVRLDPAMASGLSLTPGDFISLVVRDTGHGMTPETQARIFDPFFTTKPPGKGTGLGLAMVYGIVRQSGGAISVDSEEGRGATFRIYFPRVAEASDRLPAVITPSSVPVTRQRRDATIMLVEDDPAVRVLTRRMMEEAGFTVREASDAYEALTLAGPQGEGIDLVVSDVIMPGMGGRDLARELRSRRDDLRILFISGYLDIDVPRLGLNRTTRLLSKPFTRDSLLRQVHHLLDEQPPALAGEPS